MGDYRRSGVRETKETKVVKERVTRVVLNNIIENTEQGSQIMSDKFGVYTKTVQLGFHREAINDFEKDSA